ncbi:MAG TPA: hypothetical protein PK977_01410, partial [Chitinophagaceae bacterium]|nr:hypothetical protein [Chitinophagaceae bacterium]
RIDGGTVNLNEVISYSKGGQTVSVNSNLSSQPNFSNAAPKDCELKNVGDVLFENKSNSEITVYIYAIGVQPDGRSGQQTNNPIIATVSVPANGTASAYDLTVGTHFIYFISTGYRYSGQIRIRKCETSREALRVQNLY